MNIKSLAFFTLGVISASLVFTPLLMGLLYQGYSAVLFEQNEFYELTASDQEQQRNERRKWLQETALPYQACATFDLHRRFVGVIFYSSQSVEESIISSLKNVGINTSRDALAADCNSIMQ